MESSREMNILMAYVSSLLCFANKQEHILAFMVVEQNLESVWAMSAKQKMSDLWGSPLIKQQKIWVQAQISTFPYAPTSHFYYKHIHSSP